MEARAVQLLDTRRLRQQPGAQRSESHAEDDALIRRCRAEEAVLDDSHEGDNLARYSEEGLDLIPRRQDGWFFQGLAEVAIEFFEDRQGFLLHLGAIGS